MPFDGMFLYSVCAQLRAAVGGKIEKIHQPAPDEIVLALHCASGPRRVLISAGADAARIQFTALRQDNPPTAPAFCMLLRKALTRAKLSGVRQAGLDRVCALDFECVNELGDPVRRTLYCELMGRHSNIVLTERAQLPSDPEPQDLTQDPPAADRILDAVRRVDFSMSTVRQLLPGRTYELPVPQEKIAPWQVSPEFLAGKLAQTPDAPAHKVLLSLLSGLSPLLSRELCVRAGYPADVRAGQVDPQALTAAIKWLGDLLQTESFIPMALSDESRGLFEFSFTDICQYGDYAKKTVYPDAGTLLDDYYAARARKQVVQSRGTDIVKTVNHHITRLRRKTQAQREEMADNEDREHLRIWGEAIMANLYRIGPGDTTLETPDFYHAGQTLQIPLDPTLTPAETAQRYYKQYRKARQANIHLTAELEKSAVEIAYLQSVLDALSRTETGAELAQIRQELAQAGYLRTQAGKGHTLKKAPPQKADFHRFIYDGTEILAGRNNLQNEQLTHKIADKNDWWLHTLNLPGSHVIVRAADPDAQTLAFAARIAALYSAGAQAGKIAVDATRVRYVKKQPGGKPGMVTYTHQKTFYVAADPGEADKTRKK